MSMLRYAVIFLAVVSVTVAIKCYTGNTSNKDKPKNSEDCPKLSRYCLKKSVKESKEILNYYGCATTECSKKGCETDANKMTTCCCNKDLCNTSSQLFSLLSITPILLAKLVL